MRPTESSDDFERRLERELRLHVARSQRPNPPATEPVYRSALRGRWASFRTSGILGKGAAGLVAAVLTVGGGSAVAMAATGSHDPVGLARSVAQIVDACKDQVRGEDVGRSAASDSGSPPANAARNIHGIGQCVSAQVSHGRTGNASQQASGASSTNDRSTASRGSSPGTHQNQGQGMTGGSPGPLGQSGTGHGNGDGRGNHGNPGDHGHHPTPTPSP
jgi:hypothetical protein